MTASWVKRQMDHLRSQCVPAEMLATPVPERKGNWMLTHTGRVYYPVDPRAGDVHIDDIAHSLSMQCRYNGHCSRFYSVAEHSWRMSFLVEPENALAALLHDATEAYVADVPRPLKPFLANYEELERENWWAISSAFGLPLVLPDEVTDLDRRMCKAEMIQLMPHSPLPLGIEGETPNVGHLTGYNPAEMRNLFRQRFNQLWNTRMSALHPAAYTPEAA